MKDAILIYILIAIVLILPIVGRVLKRKARRSGEERFREKQDRNAGENGLGARIVLGTNGAAAAALVGPILEAGSRVERQEDGSWAQTNFNTDDVIYSITSTSTHSVVGVSRAIEFAGALSGMRPWNRFRKEITAEANRQMIPVSEDVHALVRAPGVLINGAQVWVPGPPA